MCTVACGSRVEFPSHLRLEPPFSLARASPGAWGGGRGVPPGGKSSPVTPAARGTEAAGKGQYPCRVRGSRPLLAAPLCRPVTGTHSGEQGLEGRVRLWLRFSLFSPLNPGCSGQREREKPPEVLLRTPGHSMKNISRQTPHHKCFQRCRWLCRTASRTSISPHRPVIASSLCRHGPFHTAKAAYCTPTVSAALRRLCEMDIASISSAILRVQ